MSDFLENSIVKLFIWAAFVQIFAFPAKSTTIVAVKTKKEIVIGADSKVTDTFGNTLERQACKIVQAGNVFFAYAGFARNSETDFNLPQIAADALNSKPKAKTAEKVEILTNIVIEKLNAEISVLKEKSFPTYREKIEGRIFLRILVAGFEKGKPALYVRQFRLGQTNEKGIGVIASNNDCDRKCKGENVTRFLGETAAIDGLPEETKDFWKSGLAEGVNKLIETQIAAREEYVGAPIDILQITAKNAVWIRKKDSCPDIKNYKK